MFAEAGVRINGKPAAFTLKSNAGNLVTRIFCKTCGSPLFGKNDAMLSFMTVTLGTLDDPDLLTPQVAIFARTHRAWDEIDQKLAIFDTQPAWMPQDELFDEPA